MREGVESMILGISASGSNGGISAAAVQSVLEASGLSSTYVSAAGKQINGCTGCLRCAGDNVCKVDDDWLEIGALMTKADAIVFGAPNYYGMVNAIGHAIWERTYSFRHNSRFSLAGKLGVIVGTNDESKQSVIPFVRLMLAENKMAHVGEMTVQGYAPCYRCGYGHHCVVGSVVSDHGFLDCIEDEHLPDHFSTQCSATERATRLGMVLKGILG